MLERACDSTGKQEVVRSFEYDTNGTVKKAIAGGFCYTYQYRPDGKLLRKESSGKTVLACSYFSDGSLKSLTDVSGKTIYYQYDWQGKLSEIQDETGKPLVQYSHTLGGKVKKIHHSNGMCTLYEYDTEENIIHLRLENKNGETISDVQYDYDGNGNRILKTGSLTDQTGLRPSRISYGYDKKNQLTKESYDGEAISYHYDLCGNRLEKKDKNGVERYTYNSKNQLVSRISNLENISYQYDLQGNVLKATGTDGITTYGYNAFNQQTSVSMPDGSTLENYYDAEYLRAGTVENGKARKFLYYNGELLAESKTNTPTGIETKKKNQADNKIETKVELGTEDTVISRYILGYGVAVGWNQERKGYYSYHLDEQNSTAYLTDETGTIQNSYEYGAFGDIRNQQENIHNRILYTGQQYDQVSGQYYLRARFYNPIVGRFLQEDVYRRDGLNLYAYCANNPVMYYDPSGYGKQDELLRFANSQATESERYMKLIERRNEYINSKKERGKLKVSQKPLQKYELEVETFSKASGETNDGVTPHHMPSAESMKDKVAYGDCSCLNVLEETHEATFTYGMGSKRKGDKALYESLSDEMRLKFDNEDLINAYKVTRPDVVDINEVKEAVEKQNKHSMGIINEANNNNQANNNQGGCPSK